MASKMEHKIRRRASHSEIEPNPLNFISSDLTGVAFIIHFTSSLCFEFTILEAILILLWLVKTLIFIQAVSTCTQYFARRKTTHLNETQ